MPILPRWHRVADFKPRRVVVLEDSVERRSVKKIEDSFELSSIEQRAGQLSSYQRARRAKYLGGAV